MRFLQKNCKWGVEWQLIQNSVLNLNLMVLLQDISVHRLDDFQGITHEQSGSSIPLYRLYHSYSPNNFLLAISQPRLTV